MGIKYHQYGMEYDYAKDGALTNNWNPDLDYGTEYVSVYFNIKTPSYDINGFTSPEARDNWNEEADRLIQSFGIMEDCGYKVENREEKCAYLYAHPQQISGVILKNDVKKLAEAIDNMQLSSLRWVDLYETVYAISDKEYEKYLNKRKEEIRKALFQKSATNRKTTYYLADNVARLVAKTFQLNRLGITNEKYYGKGQTTHYVRNVIEEMIKEGYLKSSEKDGEIYIRSLNKTEQRQSKLKAL